MLEITRESERLVKWKRMRRLKALYREQKERELSRSNFQGESQLLDLSSTIGFGDNTPPRAISEASWAAKCQK